MTYPNLKAEMARNGVSVERVAEAAGVSTRTVNNWMNGASTPSMEQAKVIKRELLPNHTLEYLFE